jgi:S1-C subfamily serine protease
VSFIEKDVSRDQVAAQEMVQRSGQMGVPVITVDGSVVVGFDQPRLERLLATAGARPRRLGASVRSVPGGVLVGTVHPGSLAAKAGLQPSDVIETVESGDVATPEQLEQRLERLLQHGTQVRLGIQRGGKRMPVVLALSSS